MTAAMPNNEKFADVDSVAESIISAIDKRKDILYVPLPVATDHVHHPQFARAHLQKAESINSVAARSNFYEFWFAASGKTANYGAFPLGPLSALLISRIPKSKGTLSKILSK
jgi:hypothetical protein